MSGSYGKRLFRGSTLNLLKLPKGKITDLSEKTFISLCTSNPQKSLSYPIYIICNNPRFFELTNYNGIHVIQTPAAVKEIDFSNNKLTEIDNLERFIRLKRLYLSNNQIDSVKLSNPNLLHLDLTENRLRNVPELNDLVNLKTLLLGSNEMSTCSLKGIEKCVNLESIDFSNNLMSLSDTEIEELLSILEKLPKLHSLNISNTDMVVSLVSYRGTFLSRLTQLDELNGDAVTRVERETFKKDPVKVMFLKDVKRRKLEYNLKEYQKPSFEKAQKNDFFDVYQVLKVTSPDDLGYFSEIFLDLVEGFLQENKRIESSGLPTFYNCIGEKMVLATTPGMKKSLCQSFLVSTLMIPIDSPIIEDECLKEAIYLVDTCDSEFMAALSIIKFEYVQMLVILSKLLKGKDTTDDYLKKQGYHFFFKFFLENYNEARMSHIVLSLFVDSLPYVTSLYSSETLKKFKLMDKLTGIVNKWTLTADTGLDVLKILIATHHVIASEFFAQKTISEKILTFIQNFNLTPNCSELEIQCYVNSLICCACMCRNKDWEQLQRNLKFNSIYVEKIKETLEMDKPSAKDHILLNGVLQCMLYLSQYEHDKEALRELIQGVPFKSLFNKANDLTNVFKLMSFAQKEGLLKEENLLDSVLQLGSDNVEGLKFLLLILNPAEFATMEKRSLLVNLLKNIILNSKITKSDFTKDSKRSLAVELYVKLKITEYMERIVPQMLEILCVASKQFDRHVEFIQKTVKELSTLQIEDTESNARLVRVILQNEEASQLISQHGASRIEETLKPETLVRLHGAVQKGTQVFNRLYRVLTNAMERNPALLDSYVKLHGIQSLQSLIRTDMPEILIVPPINSVLSENQPSSTTPDTDATIVTYKNDSIPTVRHPDSKKVYNLQQIKKKLLTEELNYNKILKDVTPMKFSNFGTDDNSSLLVDGEISEDVSDLELDPSSAINTTTTAVVTNRANSTPAVATSNIAISTKLSTNTNNNNNNNNDILTPTPTADGLEQLQHHQQSAMKKTPPTRVYRKSIYLTQGVDAALTNMKPSNDDGGNTFEQTMWSYYPKEYGLNSLVRFVDVFTGKEERNVQELYDSIAHRKQTTPLKSSSMSLVLILKVIHLLLKRDNTRSELFKSGGGLDCSVVEQLSTFVLRVSKECENLLNFQATYLLAAVLDSLLETKIKVVSWKVPIPLDFKDVKFLVEASSTLMKINQVITKRFAKEKSQFNSEEMFLLDLVGSIVSRILQCVYNLQYITETDLDTLLAKDQDTSANPESTHVMTNAEKNYHWLRLNRHCAMKLLKFMLPQQQVANLATFLFNAARGPHPGQVDKYWNSDVQYVIVPKFSLINNSIENLTSLFTSVIAGYMNLMDAYEHYDVLNYMETVDVLGGFQAENKLFQGILDKLRENQDNLELQRYLSKEINSKSIELLHTIWQPQEHMVYVFCNDGNLRILTFEDSFSIAADKTRTLSYDALATANLAQTLSCYEKLDNYQKQYLSQLLSKQ